jgi:hypothetical protein
MRYQSMKCSKMKCRDWLALFIGFIGFIVDTVDVVDTVELLILRLPRSSGHRD